MAKKSNNRKPGSVYNSIIRENLQQIFLPLVKEKLNVKIKSIHPLPDKQATTLVRETDAFLLVETEEGEKFILHIEFQSTDDHSMIYRISEHHGIELRKYRLPIKHFVVYLGDKMPRMKTTLAANEVFTSFDLINIKTFEASQWLAKDEPEKIILAIFGKYDKDKVELILEAIIQKLRKVCKSQSNLKKFIQQLIFLSRLRNLGKSITDKISKAMPVIIDVENDYLFKLGVKKERQKAEQEKAELLRQQTTRMTQLLNKERKTSIKNMLNAKLKKEQIANFLNLTVQEVNRFIREIKKEIKEKK